MLEEPHHLDVIERRFREGQLECVRLAKVSLQTELSEVSASCFELARLDVHASQHDARESRAEDAQHGGDTTADLKQAAGAFRGQVSSRQESIRPANAPLAATDVPAQRSRSRGRTPQ
jgi:hypothetical protein